MRKLIVLFLASAAFLGCKTSYQTKTQHAQGVRKDISVSQAAGTQYAIATQGIYASKAAQWAFEQGGNIIDAMVAASFVISVERPQSTGIGGGGFLVYFDSKTQKKYAIDFRERAPLKATEKMFVKNGVVRNDLAQDSILSVAVPGMVAGLSEIHEKFGKLSWGELLRPSIELADNGFDLYPEFRRALIARHAQILKDPEAAKIFLIEGKVPELGFKIYQKDLAQSLRLIAEKGRDGFYKGKIANSIVGLSKKQNGIISQKDLDTYTVKWREPIEVTYKNYEVVSMPPPSSGGVHVIQFLEFLEGDSLKSKKPFSAESIHLAASALQSSFADRAKYLGDPDFVKVPVTGLISKDYIKSRRQEVDLSKARKLSQVQAGIPQAYESVETTHLSLIDAQGNAVSTTQTINGWMGSGIVAPGTGIVLNNEMDDFSAQEGASNLFGAVGGKPNAIAPLKTPLSSMSPTIVMKDNKPILAVGAPGGTRIISCVAQTILNYLEFQMPLVESVASIRYHHQWQPDTLFIDPPGPTPEVKKSLEDMGYKVSIEPVPCYVMAVSKEGKTLKAVADPRDIGIGIAK